MRRGRSRSESTMVRWTFFIGLKKKNMISTDSILHICTFLRNPMPILTCSKMLYRLRFHDMFFPLPYPRPERISSNYELAKRKTLLQTHCFLCGGEMGIYSAMMICNCLGWYPKMHPLCLDALKQVGTTRCPICKHKGIYFVFKY